MYCTKNNYVAWLGASLGTHTGFNAYDTINDVMVKKKIPVDGMDDRLWAKYTGK